MADDETVTRIRCDFCKAEHLVVYGWRSTSVEAWRRLCWGCWDYKERQRLRRIAEQK